MQKIDRSTGAAIIQLKPGTLLSYRAREEKSTDCITALHHYRLDQRGPERRSNSKYHSPPSHRPHSDAVVCHEGYVGSRRYHHYYKEDFKDDLIIQHWHRFTAVGFHGLKCSVYILLRPATCELRWDSAPSSDSTKIISYCKAAMVGGGAGTPVSLINVKVNSLPRGPWIWLTSQLTLLTVTWLEPSPPSTYTVSSCPPAQTHIQL